MTMERRTTAADCERAIWRTYARTGHLLNVFVLVIDTAYVLATWTTGAHRPCLMGLNLAAIAGMVVAFLIVPEERVASSPNRERFFVLWILTGAVLITTAAWADGGVRSPLAWLLPISVMFTAVAHRPAVVWVSGTFAVVGYLIVTVTSPMTIGVANTLTRFAYLGALTFAAASAARSRWDHHDAQQVLHEELSLLADVDGLTGALNHRAFHERLDDELAGCARRSLPAVLLLIDLDHFKSINDRFGHGAGDEVLRRVGAAISGSVRSGDIVGRVGGEEFAVCLGASTMGEAHRIAERVHAAIATIDEPELVTASIGIGTADAGPMMAPDLLGRADEALYLAKHQGRNRTCWLRVA